MSEEKPEYPEEKPSKQGSVSGALRDEAKQGCEGDYKGKNEQETQMVLLTRKNSYNLHEDRELW